MNMYLSKVESNKAIPSTEPLTVVWINDNYNEYEHFRQSTMQKCSLNRSISRKYSCHKFIFLQGNTVDREYYLIKYKSELDQILQLDLFRVQDVSWQKAAYMCGELGGYLPWFGSRDSLNEFLSLFKLSQYMPTFEAIYIGLKFHENEVSECCFVSWSWIDSQ